MTRPASSAPRSREANLVLHAAAAGDARALARLIIRHQLGVEPEELSQQQQLQQQQMPSPSSNVTARRTLAARRNSLVVGLPTSGAAFAAAAAAASSVASPPPPAFSSSSSTSPSSRSRRLGRRGSLAVIPSAVAAAAVGGSTGSGASYHRSGGAISPSRAIASSFASSSSPASPYSAATSALSLRSAAADDELEMDGSPPLLRHHRRRQDARRARLGWPASAQHHAGGDGLETDQEMHGVDTAAARPLPLQRRRFSAADLLATATSLTPSKLLKVSASDGSTPLHIAAKRGHREVVELLLTLGASLDDRDSDPKRQGNVLHYACWGGHIDLVRWLLDERGADAGATDVVGNTPLLYAVYGGHRIVTEELLRRGRSLRERNHKNHSAILQAACGGHLELVEYLLDQGFSLAEADHDGNTALLFAAWGGHQRLMEYLVSRGASLHEVNHNGHSVFLSAANGGRVEVVEWLLECGFSLNETNNNGDTALLLAAYGGHRPLVERLLELGASLEDTNACGFTPLLSAANGGQLEMAAWLLQRGADLTEADNDGYTSLILAACGGNIELVNFFLLRGAKLTERNSNGDSALLLAAYCGHTRLVHWLLDHGASLSERNNTGMGVLISAANGGHLDTVRAVHERLGGGVGLESTDEGGYTPLLLAAQRGHLETVKYLACHGANLHARTLRHGNDAIALAAEFPEVQEYLRFIWNFNALQICADARMTDRVHEMLCAGTDPTGSAGQAATPTPLQLACSVGQYSTAKPVDPELAGLLQMAVKPWSPTRHCLYGRSFKRMVVFMLWLKKELDCSAHLPYLPPEIWLHIISCMRRDWFSDATVGVRCPVQPQRAMLRRRSRATLLAGSSGGSSVNLFRRRGSLLSSAGSAAALAPGISGSPLASAAQTAQSSRISLLSEPLRALIDAADGSVSSSENGDGEDDADAELFTMGMDDMPEQLALAEGTPGRVTPQAALDPEDAMDVDTELMDPYAKSSLSQHEARVLVYQQQLLHQQLLPHQPHPTGEENVLVRITWV